MRRASFALALTAATLFALAPAALAQRLDNARLGASVNAYFFTADRHARNAFGDPAITYGANLTAITRPRAGRLSFSYDVIAASRGDSTLFLLPLTVGIEKHFGDRQERTMPYARLEAGGAYYDVAIHNGDYDKSFKTGGVLGAAEVGLVLNRTFSVKAKYYLFQDRFGVNLSGAQFGLVYNFIGL